jgi:beta-lactam-binding protein with PASTA domain
MSLQRTLLKPSTSGRAIALWTLAVVTAAAVMLAGVAGCNSKVATPRVVDKPLAEAQAAITSAGFVVGSVTTTSSSTVASGTVVDQSPSAGAVLAKGSEITLVVSKGQPQTKVPDVMGKTRDEAFSALTDVGLQANQIDVADAAPKGQVFGQEPTAGSEVASGTTVVVAVSAGPDAATMSVPKVTGMTQAAAKEALEKDAFVPVIIKESVSGVAKGKVSAQLPAAGAKATPGSEIAVAVSTGPVTLPSVTVPNVTGKKQADASNALIAAGLVPTPIVSYTDLAPVGIVADQEPRSGAKLEAGSEVAFVVSKGSGPSPAKVTVPNVVGKAQSDATSLVKRKGLYPVVVKDYSATVKAGVVISQLPAAQTKTSPGSAVGVLVSLGPAKGTAMKVPNVVNKTRADAESLLKKAGFVPYVISMLTPSTGKGNVAAQSPTGGAKARTGSEVAIIVSKGKVSLTAKVPNVVGKTEADAKTAIANAGFIPYVVPVPSTTARGKVVGQLPKASASAPLGSEVAIAVSMGSVSDGTIENVPGIEGQ